jgi:hypothetical protein
MGRVVERGWALLIPDFFTAMMLFFILAFPLLLPKHLAASHAWIPDDARLNGINIVGGPGSGKSRLMGRLIAYLDFLRGLPVIILDPLGATIDNFLHRIALLSREHQERLWPHVLYLNVNDYERVVPFPLLDRLSATESLASIALRFIEVVRRLDPNLTNAAMEGTNALIRLGEPVLMILASLNLPITEAPSLIAHPEWWKQRFEQAKAAYPEVQPAIDFMLEFARNKPDFRTRRSESFLTKLQPFLLDPNMRAMFCAPPPGLDWAKLFQQGYAVLIDFRHELTEEYKRFKLLWIFMNLFTYLNARGSGGRAQPVSLLIDELTSFVNFRDSNGKSVMADDIERLVSVIARNHGVWLTLASQGLSQFDPRIQNTLMRMGSQMLGNTQVQLDALYLARQFIPLDPYWEKKREAVWMSVTLPPIYEMFGGPAGPIPKIIDYRTVEFTPEEQDRMGMNRFQKLDELTFLTKLATREGRLHAPLRKMSIASIDPGLYLDSFPTGELRQMLSARHGFQKAAILEQIEQQSLKSVKKKPVQASKEPAKLNNSHDSTNHLSVTPAPAKPVPAPRKEPRASSEPDDEPIFQ